MRLVHNERNGEAFDSQLVIGVRESYVNLCSNTQDKLQVIKTEFHLSLLSQFSLLADFLIEKMPVKDIDRKFLALVNNTPLNITK